MASRKPTDQALGTSGASSEDRFRAITEASPNIIVITRLSDGKIAYINPAVAAVAGIAPEALIGQLAPEFYADPADRAEYVRQLKTAGRVRDFEVMLKKGDGTPYWALVNSSVIDLDGEPHVLAEVMDITHRKELTDAALESEARFRDFAETASDWFWEMDADLRFCYISEAATKIMRLPAETALGKTRAELFAELGGDEIGTEEWQAHLDTLARHQPFRDFRYWARDGAGEAHRFSLSGKPIFTADGTFQGYRGTGRDVTELANAMEALRAAKEEAEAANAAKSDFLASMSHELRTPLNAIIGFSQLLELRFGQIPEAAARENLRHISASGDHLLKLVNQVLDLAQIESGTVEIVPEAVPARALAAECVDFVSPIASARSVSVSVSGAGAPDPVVWVDRFRTKQVMLNLLSNAIKYNVPDGTVRVSVAAADGGQVRFSVTDSGTGIAADKHGQLFEPFARLGRESLNIEGAGIGLALSKRLVEMMGGAVGFDSTPGVGSTFWIDLPPAD